MKKIFVIALAMMVWLTSCDFGNIGQTVTGQSFDLVVVGSDRVWRDSAGIKLKALLSEDMPGMAQSEEFFTVSFVRSEEFSGLFKPVRNILFFDIDEKKYTLGKISYAKDVWAKTQAVARITAPDLESFEETYRENIEKIRRFYLNAECDRALDFWTKHRNAEHMDSVKVKFGANLVIPNTINLAKYADDFCWFSNGNVNFMQSIIVYRVPYKSQDDFKSERLLAVRDSFLKANLPGPTEGSYMTTEYRFIPPEATAVTSKDGKYSMEIRGLWRVEGDMMGGPFVSRTYLDKENRYLITAEAFVYAPNEKKRAAFRQLEGLISGVRFE